MSFGELMHRMTQAVCAGDGEAAAACFTEDGVYHDVFYGTFEGRMAIAKMVEELFHRDGGNFRWDLHDPVDDGRIGYVRYVFSYDSKLPEAAGRRSVFEGVSIVHLANGRIAEYREVANIGTGLVLMGFAPERIVRLMQRQADELVGRAGVTGRPDR